MSRYVEVIYLDDNRQLISSKRQDYPVLEANEKFDLTVSKLTKNKTTALVCLRGEDHELINSAAVGYDPTLTIKPIKYKIANDKK